ncbi:MAG: hypothetical protein L0G99_07525 [Propionibacteriales bacterium]|nr:hypothetical protein [Propionibacteriales bacterium]
MITSELLRIRLSTAARVLLILAVAEAVVVGLIFSFLPALVGGLTALNDVIPNATEADQLDGNQLSALSLANPVTQGVVVDLLGNTGSGIGFPVIAALLLGALTVSIEHGRGSLTASVLAEPRRARLLLVKVAALAGAVLAAAMLLALIRGVILSIGGVANGVPLLLSPSDLTGLWIRGALSLMLYAILGFSVGLLIRSPMTVTLVLGAAVVVETIVRPVTTLIAGVPNPALYLPFGLTPDLSGSNPLATFTGADVIGTNVSPGMAVAALAAWALIVLVIASVRFVRTDLPDRQ